MAMPSPRVLLLGPPGSMVAARLHCSDVSSSRSWWRHQSSGFFPFSMTNKMNQMRANTAPSQLSERSGRSGRTGNYTALPGTVGKPIPCICAALHYPSSCLGYVSQPHYPTEETEAESTRTAELSFPACLSPHAHLCVFVFTLPGKCESSSLSSVTNNFCRCLFHCLCL